MPTQIVNNGVSIKITSSGITKYITKSSILSVQVINGTTIKLDNGKGALYNIYVNQQDVTSPTSTDANDLRDQIEAMLQPVATSGGDATAANQLLANSELLNIKNSIGTLNASVTTLNTNMGTLNTGMGTLNTSVGSVNNGMTTLNDKVFFKPKMVDETNGNIIYRGYAVPGTLGSSHTWAIQRIINDNGILSYHWANGDKNFDKSWDDRTTYLYS